MSETRSDTSLPAWQWSERREGVTVLFYGRGAGASPEELVARTDGGPRSVSWLRQVHSNFVCTGEPGLAGEGDALVSRERDLGLAVATADCVPVLLATEDSIAAVHAGWRGLEVGVLAAAVTALETEAPVEAWIGPAIGPCCYEVGDDVAGRLRDVAPSAAFSEGPSGRPHVDLPAIARYQLEAAHVTEVRSIGLCTRCEPALLESFRRDGENAGRNWAMIWKT